MSFSFCLGENSEKFECPWLGVDRVYDGASDFYFVCPTESKTEELHFVLSFVQKLQKLGTPRQPKKQVMWQQAWCPSMKQFWTQVQATQDVMTKRAFHLGFSMMTLLKEITKFDRVRSTRLFVNKRDYCKRFRRRPQNQIKMLKWTRFNSFNLTSVIYQFCLPVSGFPFNVRNVPRIMLQAARMTFVFIFLSVRFHPFAFTCMSPKYAEWKWSQFG